MLTVKLMVVPPSSADGIYGKSKDQLPERMRFLHPDAAASLARMAAGGRTHRCSDMLRTAESSLQAYAEKRGTLPPGYSAHNYGFSLDSAIDFMMATYHMSKPELDAHMDANGWVCHRVDHAVHESESWHYNYLGDPTSDEGKKYRALVKSSSAAAVEQKIQDYYGTSLVLNDAEVQACLQKLHMYSGTIDGKLGPLSKQALKAFQRAWNLDETGLLDIRVERTLAFVAADREIVA